MKIPLFSKKPEIAIDPVCHMEVDKANPNGGSAQFDNVEYYFCGPGCRVAFIKEPEAYLKGEKKIDMDGH